jgi:hypothetical protein
MGDQSPWLGACDSEFGSGRSGPRSVLLPKEHRNMVKSLNSFWVDL